MSSGTLIGMRPVLSLPVFAVLVAACAGGGGSFSGDYQDTQDRATNSLDGVDKVNERSAISNEAVPSTSERPSGGNGATTTAASGTGGFNCLGTFKCTVGTNIPGTNTPKTPTTTLSLPGVCSYQGTGFNPDGTLTKDGEVIGTWSVTPTGFTVTETITISTGTTSSSSGSSTSKTTVTATLDCTKISDTFDPKATGAGDDDDDVAQTPSVDAGTR